MEYNNILTITHEDGSGIVIRRGGNNDWAAYWLAIGDDLQSGNLLKLTHHTKVFSVVQDLVNLMFPGLTYRR